MPLDLDMDMLFKEDPCDDDRPPEIIITKPSKGFVERDHEFELKTEKELKEMIMKNKNHVFSFGHKLPDKGEKLRLTIQRCEDELERRLKMNQNNKVGVKGQETLVYSDLSDECESGRKETSDQKFKNSPSFANLLLKKMDENKNSRTVNAFDVSFLSQRIKKSKNSNQGSGNGQSKPMFSSKPKPSRSRTTRKVDNMKNIISNGGKVNSRATTSSCDFSSRRRAHTPPKQPLTKSRTRHGSSYNLVDEDDDEVEEPMVWKPPVEKLSDCMKDVKVYYPSKDDRDIVEVNYKDMECLEPEAWLSSAIMNFYIRYLQQLISSSENMIQNCHFFNTFFYSQLQKNYKGDSFLKFRKWWKRVNLFEKAYIFIPIHQSAHWSLAIICIPNKEDELGPVILHLDSLGLHNSSSIFDNIRSFVEEEWSYLRNLEDSLDLPITDEIWENLDDRIIDKRIEVPRQRNANDCGLFVLFYIERFLKEAPERLREKDLSMFSKQWFCPEEASNLRWTINDLLVGEFKIAKEKETAALSPEI
ncbi:Peptidase C48, SUMO/Sentrin/Ubl1 [Artemisia annua]|uniref:Peptidase C48, SUMO/Sentrin/Ubl1 n=1 Tax=Artemisia annua TaxID=35608 RepID=A0A2U1PZ04_ARTAN|nr:Peptidase C48, SUMO/Sentrin/Ubl1 [Artemisia annua]